MSKDGTQAVFMISPDDNVATALGDLVPGSITVRGGHGIKSVEALDSIAAGHKISLKDIKAGDCIVKYGVVIGKATADIPKGSWVHLYNMASRYDERSPHLNVFTGAPEDTRYE